MSYHSQRLCRCTLISSLVLGLLAVGGYGASANNIGSASGNNGTGTVHVHRIMNTGSSSMSGTKANQPTSSAVISRSTTKKYQHILNGMNHYYGTENAQKSSAADNSLSRTYVKKYLRPRQLTTAKTSRSSAARHSNASQVKRLIDELETPAAGTKLNSVSPVKRSVKLTKKSSSRPIESSRIKKRTVRHSVLRNRPSHLITLLERSPNRQRNFQLASIAAKPKAQPQITRRLRQSSNQEQRSRLGSQISQISNSVADWFRDGLDDNELQARNWISVRESGNNWQILSYGGRCIGYFQLNPAYLGYVNGHLNLDPKHQVKVADRYVQSRYGDWIGAKSFWQNHRWY